MVIPSDIKRRLFHRGHSPHWCRACDRVVDRVVSAERQTRATLITVECHGVRESRSVSDIEVEDSRRLDYFAPAPAQEAAAP